MALATKNPPPNVIATGRHSRYPGRFAEADKGPESVTAAAASSLRREPPVSNGFGSIPSGEGQGAQRNRLRVRPASAGHLSFRLRSGILRWRPSHCAR